MDVEFGFLALPGSYAATIPDHLAGARELSSIVVADGVPRNVHFGPEPGALPGLVLVGTFAAAGTMVSLYDQVGTRVADPMSASVPVFDVTADFIDDSEFFAQRFVYWRLTTGSVSTHFFPADEGEQTLRTLIDCMAVSEPRPGFPRVELREPLRAGNIREPAERETVTFQTDEATRAPWTVTFAYAGALARDSEFTEAGMAGVTRATPLGITVFCDGPASRLGELRTAAERTAGSLRELPEAAPPEASPSGGP